MATEKTETHLHTHDFIEIAYVASGEGVHQIADQSYTVSKGDIFVINYDIAHQFRSYSDLSLPRLVVYNCIFRPEFVDYSLINCKDFSEITHHFLFNSLFPEEERGACDIKIIGEDCLEIEDLYMKMYREYTLKTKGYIEMLRAYVITLLVTIFRLYSVNKEAKSKINMQRKEIIENAITYMQQNYNKDLKIENISMKSFLSRNYFCKLFKECTGMTAIEYIQKLRIRKACDLLKKTDKTVLEIAEQVGYNDIKFFNEVFKRYVGKTPGAYR